MAQVKVFVTLKPALLDAQGKVVQGALQQLGYSIVQQVRIGKYIEMNVESEGLSEEQVKANVQEMCEKLLANPVIEDYEFEVIA